MAFTLGSWKADNPKNFPNKHNIKLIFKKSKRKEQKPEQVENRFYLG